MKYQHLSYLLFLFLLSPGLFAQDDMTMSDPWSRAPHQDSIRIEFPEQNAFVDFTFANAGRDHHLIKEFPLLLDSLLIIASQGIADTAVPHVITASRSTGSLWEVVVTPNENQSSRIISSGVEVTELVPPGWVVSLETGKMNARVYAFSFEDLKKLSEEEFSLASARISAVVDNRSLMRSRLEGRVIIRQERIIEDNISVKSTDDYVILSIGAGAGFLANRFYPETSFSLGISFTGKDKSTNSFLQLHQTNMILSEQLENGTFRTGYNSFLNLSYHVNSQPPGLKPVFFGGGIGLCIAEKNGLLPRNTGKLFLTTTMGRFSFGPEFYYPHWSLKNNLMGLKFNFYF